MLAENHDQGRKPICDPLVDVVHQKHCSRGLLLANLHGGLELAHVRPSLPTKKNKLLYFV